MKAVWKEEVKLRGVGFVKQVGFNPGVKKGVMDEQSGESKKEEVTGEKIGESKIEELVPEWGWQKNKGCGSRDKVKYNERSNQITLAVTYLLTYLDIFREDDDGSWLRHTVTICLFVL